MWKVERLYGFAWQKFHYRCFDFDSGEVFIYRRSKICILLVCGIVVDVF